MNQISQNFVFLTSLTVICYMSLVNSFTLNNQFNGGGRSSHYFTKFKQVSQQEWNDFYDGRDGTNKDKFVIPGNLIRPRVIPISHFSYQIEHPSTKTIEFMVKTGFSTKAPAYYTENQKSIKTMQSKWPKRILNKAPLKNDAATSKAIMQDASKWSKGSNYPAISFPLETRKGGKIRNTQRSPESRRPSSGYTDAIIFPSK